MEILIGFITFILVLVCLFLMLLILIQLPKKEAGAGIAFGGSAADALFGAGSGNALTKLTKYSASAFLGIAVLLSFLNSYAHSDAQRSRKLEQNVTEAAGSARANTPTPSAAPASPATTTNIVSGPLVAPTGESNTPGILTPAPAPARP